MDISSVISTVLSSKSVSGISESTGATKKEVTSVLTSALPSLIGGMSNQASGTDTSDGFVGALLSHAGNSTSSISSFFKNVDLSDGAKIVSHLLGSGEKSETSKISEETGVSQSKVKSILSAAAPLLMSILGQKTEEESSSKSSSAKSIVTSMLDNIDIGSILTSVLSSSSSSSGKTTTKSSGKTTTKKSTSKSSSKTSTKKSSKKSDTSAGSILSALGDILGKLNK